MLPLDDLGFIGLTKSMASFCQGALLMVLFHVCICCFVTPSMLWHVAHFAITSRHNMVMPGKKNRDFIVSVICATPLCACSWNFCTSCRCIGTGIYRRSAGFPFEEDFSMFNKQQVCQIMILGYIRALAFYFLFTWDAVIRYPCFD